MSSVFGQITSSSSGHPKPRRWPAAHFAAGPPRRPGWRGRQARTQGPSLSVLQGRVGSRTSVPSAGSAWLPLHTGAGGAVVCLRAGGSGSLSFIPGGQPCGYSLSAPSPAGIRGPAGTCLPLRACLGEGGGSEGWSRGQEAHPAPGRARSLPAPGQTQQ